MSTAFGFAFPTGLDLSQASWVVIYKLLAWVQLDIWPLFLAVHLNFLCGLSAADPTFSCCPQVFAVTGVSGFWESWAGSLMEG